MIKSSVKSKKDVIRQVTLLKRKGLAGSQVSSLSLQISRKVLSVKEIKSFYRYLVYFPIYGEVDMKYILRFLTQHGKKLFTPAFYGDKWIISELLSIDDLEKNRYNTLQPKKIVSVKTSDIDVALIPGVVFDKEGRRLGFGKGVYDKLLKDFKGLKIGLGYEFQMLKSLPEEVHDMKVDIIFTEKRILDLRVT